PLCGRPRRRPARAQGADARVHRRLLRACGDRPRCCRPWACAHRAPSQRRSRRRAESPRARAPGGGRMTREAYRREVERLLEQIRQRVSELRLLKTYGVRTPALEDKKRELRRMRSELAAMVAAGSPVAV